MSSNSTDTLLEFTAAGVMFRKLSAPAAKGANISLVPEPDNRYDPYAVKLYATVNDVLTHIGYVPKIYSRLVSVLLTHGIHVRAQVIAFDLGNNLCLVRLFLETEHHV